MTTQKNIAQSRQVAAVAAVHSTFLATLGFGLGFFVSSGFCLTLACLLAGVALTNYLWWSMAKQRVNTVGINLVYLVIFVVAAGLALYSNLTFLLWTFGFLPGIARHQVGTLGHFYWLPPTILLYAVVAWVRLKYFSEKKRR